MFSLLVIDLQVFDQLWFRLCSDNEENPCELLPNIAVLVFPHADVVESAVLFTSRRPDSLHDHEIFDFDISARFSLNLEIDCDILRAGINVIYYL